MVRCPIYQDQGQAFTVDSCLPQRRAMEEGKLRLVSLGRGNYPGKRLSIRGLPGLRALGTMHMEGNQDWGTDWHRNEGVEICYLESGRLPLLVEDHRFDLQFNDLSITRPWQLHRLGDPNLTAGRLHYILIDVGVRRPDQDWIWPHWVLLEERDLRQLTDILRHSGSPVCHANTEIRQCFQRIIQCIEAYDDGSHDSHLKVYLNELLLLMLDLLRSANIPLNRGLSGRRHTVELFLADLAQNPASVCEEWTLESMAARCGLCPSSFTQYCKDLTNMTPVNYLIRCRIERAARMLVETPQRSVTDIAFDSGFNTSQYFAYVFRRHFKCSPRELRARSGCRKLGRESKMLKAITPTTPTQPEADKGSKR